MHQQTTLMNMKCILSKDTSKFPIAVLTVKYEVINVVYSVIKQIKTIESAFFPRKCILSK